MVEAMMTFACLILPLDFLLETVVQGVSSSMRSGCIHIVPPPGRVVRTSPFSCWRWGSELMILISTAGMGYTAVGVGGDWPNWMQDVMLAVAVFCSIFSLRACIDKRLQFVFQGPAALGWVAQRSVVQT